MHDIDLDGINITHGPKRDHIWSYVAGLNEFSTSPCTGGKLPPPYISNHYYGNPNEGYM